MSNDMTIYTIAKFWSKVEVLSPHSCWVWRGCKDKRGYGTVLHKGHMIPAHRMAALLVGMIVSLTPTHDTYVLHRCDNPPCCNPAHLFVGSKKDNTQDCIRKGRFRVGRTKLSLNDVAQIRRLFREGSISHQTLAEMFDVSQGHVTNIIRGKRRI